MKIERFFSFPSHHTFTMPPVQTIFERHYTKGEWADPFAGYNSPAKHTNDINPETPTDYHLDALDFLMMFDDNSLDGVLYDRPYSNYQANQMYNGFGADKMHDNTFLANIRKKIACIIKPNGICITFCWNTQGLGTKNHFEIEAIYIINHGDFRNDTLVTVERKIQERLAIHSFQ